MTLDRAPPVAHRPRSLFAYCATHSNHASADAYLLNLGLLVLDGSREWPCRCPRVPWRRVVPPASGKASNEQLAHNLSLSLRLGSRRRTLSQPPVADAVEVGAADISSEQSEVRSGKGSDLRWVRLDDSLPGGHSASIPRRMCWSLLLGMPVAKDDFVDDAMNAKKPKDKRFRSRLPFALPHLFGMRVTAFGAAFSVWPSFGASDGVVGGVIAAWVAATIVRPLRCRTAGRSC